MAKQMPPKNKAFKEAVDQLFENLNILVGGGAVAVMPAYTQVTEFVEKVTNYEPWKTHISVYEALIILNDCLKKYLTDQPIEKTCPIAQVLNEDQILHLRTEFSDYFHSIPREYELWIEMPNMPLWGLGEIQLTKKISLVERVSPDGRRRSSTMNTLADLGQPTYQIFLRITCEGCGGGHSNSTALADALSTLKQFMECFRALKQFDFQSNTLLGALLQNRKSTSYMVDTQIPNSELSADLPNDIREYLNRVSINEKSLEVLDHNSGATLLTMDVRAAATRDEKEKALTISLSPIRKIMDCSATEWEDINRIGTALEWAFDAEINENQTQSFIQASIGLEALLGADDQNEPLVARMADRCAYLLGHTDAARDRIRKSFQELYKIRSKLVHGRRAKLSMKDATKLYHLKTLLGDVISAEMTHLARAMNQRKQ